MRRVAALGALVVLSAAGCATTPEGPPGPRDGRYQGVGPALGVCAPAIMEFDVVAGQVRGRVQGEQGGRFSGSIDAADGTGFIKLRGEFSTLVVRNDGFEATLKTACGRRKVEGRKVLLPPSLPPA